MLRFFSFLLYGLFASSAAATLTVGIIVEESVYEFVPAGNGSGPLWAYGSTQIVRIGNEVVISQMETGEGVPRLCNTRWRLLLRGEGGWSPFAEAEGYRQREPCPIAVTSEGGLFLYVNDSLTPPGTLYKECEPYLLRFPSTTTGVNPEKLSPEWNLEQPYFTDHSYRGYGVDGPNNKLLMLNIDAKTSIQHWAHLDGAGKNLSNGQITFPIRSAYPQVALKNGSAHVMAIGDIVEPVAAWREFKFAQTQRKWDYVFRILYYTWTPDIAGMPFSEPIEVANVDKTGGYINNQDLWIAPDGSAYLLYRAQEVQTALLRDKFIPGGSLIPSIHIAVVKNGNVVERRVLVEGSESKVPGNARFHEASDGTLYALLYVGGENVLMQVYPKQEDPVAIKVPLKTPFTAFSLANTRAGCAPSNTIDIFGTPLGGGNMLAYAQLTVE